jgi:formate dehydrogenase assembly factor FdhD
MPILMFAATWGAILLAALPSIARALFKMMDVSRHRSVDTLWGYVRDAEIFKDHAGAGLL